MLYLPTYLFIISCALYLIHSLLLSETHSFWQLALLGSPAMWSSNLTVHKDNFDHFQVASVMYQLDCFSYQDLAVDPLILIVLLLGGCEESLRRSIVLEWTAWICGRLLWWS